MSFGPHQGRITLKFYSVLLLTASIALAGCQTNTTAPSKKIPKDENIRTMQAEIDSDGDGVLDAIDECPETRTNVVIDTKGCEIIIEGGEALEMEFNGFFSQMSSQLSDIYDAVFAKIAESLNDHPKANVFIFGHAATSEIDKDALVTFGFDSLSRNRALIIKNNLVL